MASFTRGFTGRSRAPRDPRLPPGQYDVGKDWPVLTAEVTPHLDPENWTMTVDGLVDNATYLDAGRRCTSCRSRSTTATSTA